MSKTTNRSEDSQGQPGSPQEATANQPSTDPAHPPTAEERVVETEAAAQEQPPDPPAELDGIYPHPDQYEDDHLDLIADAMEKKRTGQGQDSGQD